MALQALMQAVSTQPMDIIYKAFFLVAFQGFLWISNLLPRSGRSILPLHYLTLRDILFSPPGVHIILKWSKTLYSNSNTQLIQLAAVPVHYFLHCVLSKLTATLRSLCSLKQGQSSVAPLGAKFLTLQYNASIPLGVQGLLCHFPNRYPCSTSKYIKRNLGIQLCLAVIATPQHPTVVASSISTFILGLGIYTLYIIIYMYQIN